MNQVAFGSDQDLKQFNNSSPAQLPVGSSLNPSLHRQKYVPYKSLTKTKFISIWNFIWNEIISWLPSQKPLTKSHLILWHQDDTSVLKFLCFSQGLYIPFFNSLHSSRSEVKKVRERSCRKRKIVNLFLT